MNTIYPYFFSFILLFISGTVCMGQNTGKIDNEFNFPQKRTFKKKNDFSGAPTLKELERQVKVLGRTENNTSNSRSSVSTLRCGASESGSTSNQSSNYRGCSNSNAYNSKDKEYKLYVSEKGVVNIELSNLQADLDLFLLYPNNRCIEFSNHGGRDKEKISKELPRGYYKIIIDGYNGATSNFKLEINCSDSDCQSFENYSNGNITRNAGWIKNYSSSALDGQVTSEKRFAGRKSLKIAYNGSTSSTNQINILKLLGNKTHGIYRLSWKMFIPRNKNAYFSLVKRPQANTEEGVMTILRYREGLAFKAKGYNYQHPDIKSSSFFQNKWIDIEVIIDLDEKNIILRVGNDTVAIWKSYLVKGSNNHGQSSVGAINFAVRSQYSQFYIDNLCFEEIERNDTIMIVDVDVPNIGILRIN